MADHCSLSPTEAGMYLATSSMSPAILTDVSVVRSWRKSVLLTYGTQILKLNVSLSKMAGILALGQPPSWTRQSVRSSQSLVCHSTNLTEEQCPPLAHWVNVELQLSHTRWQLRRSNAMSHSSHCMKQTRTSDLLEWLRDYLLISGPLTTYAINFLSLL